MMTDVYEILKDVNHIGIKSLYASCPSNYRNIILERLGLLFHLLGRKYGTYRLKN